MVICMLLEVQRECDDNLHLSKIFNFQDFKLNFCARRGQLGLGELESEEVPVLIEALAGIKVCQCDSFLFFSNKVLILFRIKQNFR